MNASDLERTPRGGDRPQSIVYANDSTPVHSLLTLSLASLYASDPVHSTRWEDRLQGIMYANDLASWYEISTSCASD